MPQQAVNALSAPSLKEVCFDDPDSIQKLRCAPFVRTIDTIRVIARTIRKHSKLRRNWVITYDFTGFNESIYPSAAVPSIGNH